MMEDFNEEYYLLYINSGTELYDSDEDRILIRNHQNKPIPEIATDELQFNIYGNEKSISKASAHPDGLMQVISEKIYDVITTLEIPNLQMFPTRLMLSAKERVEGNWWYFHPYTPIKCLDMEQSEYSIGKSGKVLSIEKMVVDGSRLKAIPLVERLVFSLAEYRPFQLFHESIVNAIRSTEPVGIRFVKVSDYHMGSAFDY